MGRQAPWPERQSRLAVGNRHDPETCPLEDYTPTASGAILQRSDGSGPPGPARAPEGTCHNIPTRS